MDAIALDESVVGRDGFGEWFTRTMFGLLACIELGHGTVIAHNASPDFATRTLGNEFDGKVQHTRFKKG